MCSFLVLRILFAKTVVDYLYDHCPRESGLMIFRRIPTTPGYEIRGVGDTKRDLIEITGLQLVIEKQALSGPLA